MLSNNGFDIADNITITSDIHEDQSDTDQSTVDTTHAITRAD